VAAYADTLAHPGAAIRLYRETFRRLVDSAAKARGKRAGRRVRTATGSSCQPPRPFWIRAKQPAGGGSGDGDPVDVDGTDHAWQSARVGQHGPHWYGNVARRLSRLTGSGTASAAPSCHA
jgi:hypothetical protein